jgi:hypothetical protein
MDGLQVKDFEVRLKQLAHFGGGGAKGGAAGALVGEEDGQQFSTWHQQIGYEPDVSGRRVGSMAQKQVCSIA